VALYDRRRERCDLRSSIQGVAAVAILIAVSGCSSQSGAPSANAGAAANPGAAATPTAGATWVGGVSAFEPGADGKLDPATNPPPLPPRLPGPKPPRGPFAWAVGPRGLFRPGNMVTLALVRGLSPGQALRVLAPAPATPVLTAAEALAWVAQQEGTPRYGTALIAGVVDGWTVVLEYGGYQASQPEMVSRLSRAGEAVVVYLEAGSGARSFQYARLGKMVRAFDPDVAGGPPLAGGPLPQERNIARQIPGVPGAVPLLELAQLVTGLKLTEAVVIGGADRIAVGIHPG
jgi:hypothetical protein